MKTQMPLATLTVVLLSILPLATAKAGEDVLMQAMRDEMTRTVEELRMADLEAPYFVSYTVRDIEQQGTQASFGALLPSSESRTRFLSVEVRVGDASFDNTNFYSMTSAVLPSIAGAALPLEDNAVEIRRQIWLATDAAYKNALQGLAAKRAALQNETRDEDLGDLGYAEPFTHIEAPGRNLPALLEMQALVRHLSGVFTRMPAIAESAARAAVRHQRIYYLNSEGSSFIRNDPSAIVNVVAQTQAPDGTVLHDFVAAYGNTWDEIADEDALTGRVTAMGQAVMARRAAAPVDQYIGPVLLEGQAAAELFAQVLAPRLLGIRTPDVEARFAAVMSRNANPFIDKLGGRVMSRSLSLRDDPTLRGDGFIGGYAVDDDAVPAHPSSLIENGMLRSLLTTRNPIKGIAGSTGNRRGATPAPSNLLLTTRQGMSREEMRAELMLLVEESQAEYGILVRRLGNPGFRPATGSMPFFGGNPQQVSVENAKLAYKVYPDGREELIQKVEFAAIADSVLKEVVAASESSTVHSFVFSPFYPPGMPVIQMGSPAINGNLVSVSAPDLLFEELTLRKAQGNLPHRPVATHPSFEE